MDNKHYRISYGAIKTEQSRLTMAYKTKKNTTSYVLDTITHKQPQTT